MFKGNEQFTTLCKRKDWTTVFCIACSPFCLKTEFTFCKTRDCVLITIPAPWSWDSSTPWKKSQIKDNHLKKYISKMSKPSLDFLKSICQQLFLVFSARIVSPLLSFTNYFCHSESGQVYTPLKMDLLSSLTNRMKIALMPMSIVEALVQIFVEVAMSILQLVVQLFTVFLSCSF